MASAQQQENMLLTEHFSWPPISLIDDIINTVNEVLYRCTDTFETGISSAPPHLLGFSDRYAAEKRNPERDDDGNDVYPDAALEIEEGVLKLETLMENAVDKNFDKLEIWTLRNVLCLPRGEVELARWVRLGHYKGVGEATGIGAGAGAGAEGRGEGVTPEALFALRRKLVETRKLHAALEAEKRRNERLIAQLKTVLGAQGSPTTKTEDGNGTASVGGEQEAKPADASLAFLTHTPAAQALGLSLLPPSSTTAAPLTTTTSSASPTPATTRPLATHTAFTTSHLPHLRSLLASLRPHLASTALPSNSPANNANGHRDSADRKLYLESQSKRILERRGVDTQEGVEGGVEGARVRSEEVSGLERVVEALGRGEGQARDGEGKEGKDGEGEEEGGEAMDVS